VSNIGQPIETSQFPIYVASYADGDWSCNLQLDKDGNIVAGSIPDLAAKIREWSHDRIKPFVVPQPLNIASGELMDKRPPFIFFTGHKDFHLTDQEVERLQEYLQAGGAIWGDNALAGVGSRFDVAFHREMKRVVPDEDKVFVPFTLDHAVFNQDHRITQVPEGMNYYAEAPEHLDLYGVPAIIYTPNDYSDLMFLRALPGDRQVYLDRKPPAGTLHTQLGFWDRRDVYYRNFDLESSTRANQLGMNIVTYFIQRFDPMLELR
jgi:hypothetical protein